MQSVIDVAYVLFPVVRAILLARATSPADVADHPLVKV